MRTNWLLVLAAVSGLAVILASCATVTEGPARSRDENFCCLGTGLCGSAEVCNGEDDDCDGLLDENWEYPCTDPGDNPRELASPRHEDPDFKDKGWPRIKAPGR